MLDRRCLGRRSCHFLGWRPIGNAHLDDGQALTAAVVVGILARCLWVSVFFRGLQRCLAEKNSALKLAVARIEGMANRDELTGLSNRRSITRHLTEQMAQSDRTLTPLSV